MPDIEPMLLIKAFKAIRFVDGDKTACVRAEIADGSTVELRAPVALVNAHIATVAQELRNLPGPNEQQAFAELRELTICPNTSGFSVVSFGIGGGLWYNLGMTRLQLLEVAGALQKAAGS
jgi:hypothetical protein